ncbi:MAG: hypothetical protein IPK07_15865 [Deltaproteobacteria bacterium]|nr:hypothetical protein [Deltaproteobacteria bacterium]
MKWPIVRVEISLPGMAWKIAPRPSSATSGSRSVTKSWSVLATYSRPIATLLITRSRRPTGESSELVQCWWKSAASQPRVSTTRSIEAVSGTLPPAGTSSGSVTLSVYSGPRVTVTRYVPGGTATSPVPVAV